MQTKKQKMLLLSIFILALPLLFNYKLPLIEAASATPLPIVPTITSKPPVTPTHQYTPTPNGQILMVSKLDDTNDGLCDQDCSLREAITNAAWGATIEFGKSVRGTIILSSPLYISQSLSVVGPGPKSSAIVISGNKAVQVFVINPNQFYATEPRSLFITLKLDLITVADGYSSTLGGGILNYGSSLIVSRSTLANNFARDHGGALSSGGVRDQNVSVIVENSTFQNNKAGTGGSVIWSWGTLKLVGITASGNYSLSSTGDVINHGLNATITNSTFANGGSGGIVNANNPRGKSSLTITNSLIVNYAKADFECLNLIDGGGNYQYQTHCNGSIPSNDPQLGPLQDNGGPVSTMLLAANSPVIGKSAVGTCPDIDARGITQSSSIKCDPGAVQSGNR